MSPYIKTRERSSLKDLSVRSRLLSENGDEVLNFVKGEAIETTARQGYTVGL